MLHTQTANSFLTEDFLLQSDYAKILYHDYAKNLPIIDYHNHLPPAEIAANRQFENISKVWLAGDHYKWRAMRTLGVHEKFITGEASDLEKFQKWSFTVPYTMRNPLYHWSHMEMRRYFGIDELLSTENATAVYHHTSEMLEHSDFRAQGLLERMNVEVVCSTDDPCDTLENHKTYFLSKKQVKLYPAFRPDKSFAIENGESFKTYLQNLGSVVGFEINSFDKLIEALSQRVDYFHSRGCRLSDHGLENLVFSKDEQLSSDSILLKVLRGNALSKEEIDHFKFKTLQKLCKMYHAKGWVQQFHLGALRNTNSRMLSTLGPDTGFDSIGDFDQASALGAFLNHLDSTDQLTKTVIYNLNPRDNEVFATMIGNFNDGSVKGKIQFGSGWWYLDQKDGMEKQINTLSNMGLVSCFIGMLTDSRSFLSFPRHEYFRRILCNIFGKDVQNGELPWDEKWLGKLITDICYQNAKDFFNFSPNNYKI
ncbi:glucuronate isomerase [Algoriphagus boritolerans]|uniref:Uronate isomerase n=1 Tax=Algoriphagus boritolerans DSM 17298 = JCM 18970 TaxID=1120964 RepID=A0A1H5TI84_9BACT|nr:glucuronate isomerase [Algoriphagus boritolerans]SEF62582.1 glucuronate isomerase [Algoriphagus boritolerans DSM 17298 = JCM 18970]